MAWFCCILWVFAALLHGGGAALAHEGHADELAVAKQLPEGAVVGSGDWRFRMTLTSFAATDASPALGVPTHGGVVVDEQGDVYATTQSGDYGFAVFRGGGGEPELIAPGIAGGHSLMLRKEAGTPYLYFCRNEQSDVYKTTLEGEVIWTISRDAFLQIPEIYVGTYINWRGKEVPRQPVVTSVALGPDNTIYVADGYGQQYVHIFDAERNYVKSFGGRGKEPGQFIACHGITLDERYDPPRLLVCDRENRRLQHFDLEGNFLEVAAEGLKRPCYAAIQGEHVAIAELKGRVTVLDGNNEVVVHLGENNDPEQAAKYPVDPAKWKAGLFTSPHGICWDGDDLLVAGWNESGRLTRLERLAD